MFWWMDLCIQGPFDYNNNFIEPPQARKPNTYCRLFFRSVRSAVVFIMNESILLLTESTMESTQDLKLRSCTSISCLNKLDWLANCSFKLVTVTYSSMVQWQCVNYTVWCWCLGKPNVYEDKSLFHRKLTKKCFWITIQDDVAVLW